MMKTFEQELVTIKTKYDETIQKVKEASENLRDMFKGKVQKIKEKSAIFFARMEMKLAENNTEVVEIAKMFREW